VKPPHWEGASSKDRHYCVFPGESQHVPRARVSVDFCTLSEEPRDHDTLHHVTVLELVPNGVCVVWLHLLEEPLEVLYRRLYLTVVVVHDGRDTHHIEATCLPIIMFSHGHAPFKAQVVPLLATLDALLAAVDRDVGWCHLGATWGHLPVSLGKMKFGCLVAGGVLGGGAAWLLEGVPKNIVVFTLTWVLCSAFW
jgi:hypothetical protein